MEKMFPFETSGLYFFHFFAPLEIKSGINHGIDKDIGVCSFFHMT